MDLVQNQRVPEVFLCLMKSTNMSSRNPNSHKSQGSDLVSRLGFRLVQALHGQTRPLPLPHSDNESWSYSQERRRQGNSTQRLKDLPFDQVTRVSSDSQNQRPPNKELTRFRIDAISYDCMLGHTWLDHHDRPSTFILHTAATVVSGVT
jgi:hypothetical protein